MYRFLLERRSKSVAEVIQCWYSKNTVKRIWKLEKLDYRLRKADVNLQFLCEYAQSDVMPVF